MGAAIIALAMAEKRRREREEVERLRREAIERELAEQRYRDFGFLPPRSDRTTR